MTTQTHVDTAHSHYAMSEESHQDLSSIVSMLRGISFMACESKPGEVMQIEDFAGLANVVHNKLEEIFTGMRYVTVQRGGGMSATPETDVLDRELRAKERIMMRFDPDVLTALREKGCGWQALVNETMRERLKSLGS